MMKTVSIPNTMMYGGDESENASEIFDRSEGEFKNKFINGEAGSEGGGSVSGRSMSSSSLATIDALSQDPLFLVLTQFFMNHKSENIVSVLMDINKSIKELNNTMKNIKK